jgi:hypothetical protein
MRRALRFGGSTHANRSLVICRGFTAQTAPPPFGPRRPPATRNKPARLPRLGPEAIAAARAPPRPCSRALGAANAARRFESAPAGTAASLRAGHNVPYPPTLSVASGRPAPKLSRGQLRPRPWSTAANSPNVWSGRVSQAEFNAPALSLLDRPRRGHWPPGCAGAGKSGPPFSFHSAQTSSGTGTMSSPSPDQCSFFVRACRPSFVAGGDPARAWAGQAGARLDFHCGDRAAPMPVPRR